MGSVHPIFRLLGRIHDPLFQVVERIQSVLGERPGTISADHRGNLFISDFDGSALDPQVGQEVIGAYNLATPLSAIEGDLRLALRQRAQEWIIDWNFPCKAVEKSDGRIRFVRRKRVSKKNAVTFRDTTGASP